MSVIRVLIVDDFEPWVRFIMTLLEDNHDIKIVATASDGLEAVEKACNLQPDLVLMDIGLPALNGIDAARQITSLTPRAKILFVSQYADPQVVRTALGAGGRGYVVKSTGAQELLCAVEAVLLGKQYVSRRLNGFDLTETTDA